MPPDARESPAVEPQPGLSPVRSRQAVELPTIVLGAKAGRTTNRQTAERAAERLAWLRNLEHETARVVDHIATARLHDRPALVVLLEAHQRIGCLVRGAA